MRNWHHELINVPQALALMPDTVRHGDNTLYIGVVENFLEFDPLVVDDNLERRFKVSEYRAANKSLYQNKQNFTRQVLDGKFTHDIKINYMLSKDDKSNYFSSHTTSVASIIAGVDYETSQPIGIKGIVPRCNLISAYKFQGMPMIASVNKMVKGNLDSYHHEKNIGYSSYFKFQDNIIPLAPGNASESQNNIAASIVNTSFSWPVRTNDVDASDYISRKTVDFIYSDLFAYGRNGKGILVISSAGNENIKITEANRYNALTKKPLLVSASKLVLGIPNDFNGNNPVFNEERAGYSNYGQRVDLCAPSSPAADFKEGDSFIYASANIKCGDVGANDNTYLFPDVNEINSSKVKLTGEIKGVFPGQAIEFGAQNSYFHELRHIKTTEFLTVNNQNFLNITLDKPVEFTKTKGSLSIVNTKAKVLVWKKDAERPQYTTNIVKVTDLRGFQNGQDVYIYPEADYNNGVQAKITNISFDTKKITVNTSLAVLPENLKIIPGQMKMKVKTIDEKGNFIVLDNINDIKYSFFSGQYVLVDDKYYNTLGKIGFKGDSQYNRGFIDHIGDNVIEAYKEIFIKSLSYGDFTSKFGGTSAASPIVCGVAAMLMSVNKTLNAAEIKHILKQTANKITGDNKYKLQDKINEYNYGYRINDYFGTGRVDASAAVAMVLNWANEPKPIMRLRHTPDGTPAGTVPDSPDIWIAPINSADTLIPDAQNKYNTLKTNQEQKIYVRVRNEGNRTSFKETDLRVLVAFTNEADPKFKFPDCWFHNTENLNMKTLLLDVKEVLPIEAGKDRVVVIQWKNLSDVWKKHNPEGKLRTFILAHIAPFDGPDVDLNDIKNNKNLSCREIIATPISINAIGANGKVDILNDHNQYELKVESQTTNKKFSFENYNIASADLDTMEFKFSLVNRTTNNVEQDVVFKKINGNWAMNTVPSNGWLQADMNISDSTLYTNYKNALLNYEFNFNNNDKEIRFNVTNA